MKKWRNSSFRTRLRVSNMIVIILVVAAIVILMTVTASRETEANNRSSLDMITRQALANFTATVKTMDQGLNSVCTGSDIQSLLLRIRGMREDVHQYSLVEQELSKLLGLSVNDSLAYDHLALLPDGKTRVIHSSDRNTEAMDDAEALFGQEENRAVAYGKKLWIRLENGSLWEIRDVYHMTPFRYVGRLAGRVKQDRLVGSGEAERSGNLALLYLDMEGQLISSAGMPDTEIPADPQKFIVENLSECTFGGQSYALSVQSNGSWTVIGLQPLIVMKAVSRHLSRIAVMTVVVGILAALAFSTLFSRGITRRIQHLVDAMKEVAKGDLDVQAPVEGTDEIGLITAHFNQTTRQTKELLDRVVQEEKHKREAEYQNLEYEYRFLQWQINPHFIYNALETVNGLAKLDGNAELSEIIARLSDYFRQNAESIRRKFVTVRQEFKSLKQYASIYRYIYGDTLEVMFRIGPGAERVYLPTMILQPILENALVHGTGNENGTLIEASADVEGENLLVRVRDNGMGMDQKTMDRLMNRDQPDTAETDKTSLGVRNVLDRMNLIYGDAAEMRIDSSIGGGTCVALRMPLDCQERKDLFGAAETGKMKEKNK